MKTALVTGSTDGIGKQTALDLAALGYRVIVHGRSDEKVSAAANELKQRLGKEAAIETWACDLSSLAEVRLRGQELFARFPKLDVFLHNASLISNARQESADGFELTLAVSHLAPFVLAHLLLPALKAAAPARVVMVSSQVHQSGRIDLADLQLTRSYSGYGAYGQAKLCNVLFANGLAARFDSHLLTANSLHPGVVGTKLLRGFGMRAGPDSLEEGAKTSVYLASSPEVEGVSGRYFTRSHEARQSREADSARLREELWSLSAELTGERWSELPRGQP
jgi:NAD(P)-dependent dehydrogenase (short-subunit alcohol dehydrogenase family)